MSYNWEQPDWPNFTYSLKDIDDLLYQFALKTGEITGLFKSLPLEIQEVSLLEIMLIESVITTKATATRDLQELVVLGVFCFSGGGRSVRYEVVI